MDQLSSQGIEHFCGVAVARAAQIPANIPRLPTIERSCSHLSLLNLGSHSKTNLRVHEYPTVLPAEEHPCFIDTSQRIIQPFAREHIFAHFHEPQSLSSDCPNHAFGERLAKLLSLIATWKELTFRS